MPISLCALRLEIAKGYNFIEFENYPHNFVNMSSRRNRETARCHGDINKNSSNDAPVYSQRPHDRRMMREITVETYTPIRPMANDTVPTTSHQPQQQQQQHQQQQQQQQQLLPKQQQPEWKQQRHRKFKTQERKVDSVKRTSVKHTSQSVADPSLEDEFPSLTGDCDDIEVGTDVNTAHLPPAGEETVAPLSPDSGRKDNSVCPETRLRDRSSSSRDSHRSNQSVSSSHSHGPNESAESNDGTVNSSVSARCHADDPGQVTDTSDVTDTSQVTQIGHATDLDHVNSPGHATASGHMTDLEVMESAVEMTGAQSSEVSTELKPFIAGNPFVESTKGLLHLYKENVMTSLESGVARSQLICMLSVPAKLVIHDLLQFTAACYPDIERMRIIRDNTPSQYMVLVKLRTQEAADAFYNGFNGIRYNSFEPDICRLVFVARVDVFDEGDSGQCSVPGFTELPTCPVCLECMDESVDGVLTVLCSHSFHAQCLARWSDTSCPVCRHLQTPQEDDEEHSGQCCQCQCRGDDLWICLVCGHIGCGRYLDGHASSHFRSTGHTFAMHMASSRVWDYVGDNFVHRLVQNRDDGKMVEVPAPGRQYKEREVDDKLQGVELEYTYMLTSQLQLQRDHYEQLLARQQLAADKAADQLLQRSLAADTDVSCLREQLATMTREKAGADKKVQCLSQRLSRCLRELQDERELNTSLRQNQLHWQQTVEQLQLQLADYQRNSHQEVSELREQVRDLMFFVDAQQKIADSTPEVRQQLATGSIIVPETSAAENNNNNSSNGSGGSSNGRGGAGRPGGAARRKHR